MRIFCARLGTETNSFSPIPTSLQDFENFCAYRPGEIPAAPVAIGAPLWAARKRLASQAFGLEVCSNVGIDPRRKKIVVVKSSHHFHAAYAPLADEVIYLASPGALLTDFSNIRYWNVLGKRWPLVEDPFAG